MFGESQRRVRNESCINGGEFKLLFFVLELLSSSHVSNIAALMWTPNRCASYSSTNFFPPFFFYCFPLIFTSLKGFGKFTVEIGSAKRAPVGSQGRVTGLI